MFTFPAARFVSNSLFAQITHLESEMNEVTEAYYTPGGIKHLAEELCDLIHSSETALRILADRYDIDVLVAMADVIEKNRRRGYYPSLPQRPLAEASRTEGAHSCSTGSAAPPSPSPQQRKEISSNHPMEGACDHAAS